VTAAPRIGDERGLVSFSIIRWVLVLVLLGLVVIEGGSIIFTTIGLQNASDAAAHDAVEAWQKSGNIDQALAAARNALDARQQEDARLPAAKFEADGAPFFEVRFVAIKEAPTIVVQHIPFLAEFAEVEVEAAARPVDPDI
jgi:hypothetical protein